MPAPQLVRMMSHGVTLLGDTACPGGVAFAFTERTGGVSTGCHASLNLGASCGDDPELVAENRRRALGAIGALGCADALITIAQVHGDRVLVVGPHAMTPPEARKAGREGADAVVCTQPDVPVLLCFADCVPVILVAPAAFAVIHSGWRGTFARIAGKAFATLVDAAACEPGDVRCYVGPHVGPDDYEVSQDLCDRFVGAFGPDVRVGERNLDLHAAVVAALVEAGARKDAIAHANVSTASHVDRFYSYRASGGNCGRHGAIACLKRAHHATVPGDGRTREMV